MTKDCRPTFGQSVVGGGAVLFIGIGLALAAFPLLRTTLWTQEAAGWAQAIGSIGAILAAFSLGRSQAAADRALESMRRATDEVHRLVLIEAVMRSFQQEIDDIQTKLDGHEHPIFIGWAHEKRIREAIAPVKTIPLFEVPSTELIYLLTGMPMQLDNFLACLSEYNQSCDDGSDSERTSNAARLRNGCAVQQMMISGARATCQNGIALRRQHTSGSQV